MFKFILICLIFPILSQAKESYSEQIKQDLVQEFDKTIPSILELKDKHPSLNFLSLTKAKKYLKTTYDIKMMDFIKQTATSELKQVPCEFFSKTTFYHFNHRHEFYYVIDPNDKNDIVIIPILSKSII